jgi:1-deoxy-D-xylulose-5-phosphate reductoisomerase
VAVSAFLAGKIAYLDIARLIAHTLERTDIAAADTLDAVLAADAQAREEARIWLESRPC